MTTAVYNCPCCGAPLAYSGESGKLECAACGNAYEPDSIEALNGARQSEISFAMPTSGFDEQDADIRAYTCDNCGAELMTDETTTATECPYCGSPTVLPARLNKGVKPEKVLPFKITKQQATEAFNEYFKGKRLLPNIFADSRNRISEIRKLYVPYWLFDCDADASMVFEAEKRRVERRGEWEIRTTEHYMVRRDGGMGFDSIPVDGSAKMDDKISESLEPYDLSAAVPFQSAVLAGAMADHADVNADICKNRAVERVENSIEDALRSTVTDYSTVRVRSKSIQTHGGKVTPVLMPVWLITTEKIENGKKKTYTFAINGQTGRLTCDVRPDMKKSVMWAAGIFAGAFAAGYGILVALSAAGVIA